MAKDIYKKSGKQKKSEKQKQKFRQKEDEELKQSDESDGELFFTSESSESMEEKPNRRTVLTDRLLSEALQKLALSSGLKQVPLEEPTFECFINYFREKGFKNIITICGAGISTSAGVPDFRTPVYGLYDNLGKYNLPYPQAIFEHSYFLQNPEPFFDLTKKLIARNFNPTRSHYFIKLLEIKGILLRHYTQNIDGLERLAGVSEDLLVEAHGSFYTKSHCLKCNKAYTYDWVNERIITEGIPKCINCNTVIKPNIVFFGENLPRRFSDCIKIDFPKADLLIIMGSSLVVEPFASIVKRVDRKCPRLIINNEEVGKKVGLVYDARRNERDIFLQGTCDNGCTQIITEMGWIDEFNQLIDEIENSSR